MGCLSAGLTFDLLHATAHASSLGPLSAVCIGATGFAASLVICCHFRSSHRAAVLWPDDSRGKCPCLMALLRSLTRRDSVLASKQARDGEMKYSECSPRVLFGF
ncbi:hypothetical protein BaRGS_00023674 [Batillaria attramentaria]|uniref:Secreted protein n=1 Tax=Batillaria attramentaria TaxID=370345 RepID=A0ABD0KD38_9CAEN